MKTNLPGDFDQLAQAAIDDVATDAQLEALESAIMESASGADVFRDMAERQAFATQSDSSEKRSLPLVVKVLMYGSVAAAAAVVTLIGAGLLYFQSSASSASDHQLASTPVTPVAAPDLGAPIELGDPLDSELSAPTAVPEPSTSLLLLSGATLLLFRRRR